MRQYRTKGGKRFGPYWFRVWWEGGRQRKAYVRPLELLEVRRACRRWEEWRFLDDAGRASLDAQDRADAERVAAVAAWKARARRDTLDALDAATARLDALYRNREAGMAAYRSARRP